eukprot:COSAG01_NODE_12941_length_1659_cov_152.476282_2_plen_102_part_01
MIISSGVVDALLYASENEFAGRRFDLSIVSVASKVAVNLIGRNEGGLTLSIEAVNAVLDELSGYFDPESRYGKRHVRRVLPVAKSVVHMVVSDVHKTFVIQH